MFKKLSLLFLCTLLLNTSLQADSELLETYTFEQEHLREEITEKKALYKKLQEKLVQELSEEEQQTVAQQLEELDDFFTTTNKRLKRLAVLIKNNTASGSTLGSLSTAFTVTSALGALGAGLYGIKQLYDYLIVPSQSSDHQKNTVETHEKWLNMSDERASIMIEKVSTAIIETKTKENSTFDLSSGAQTNAALAQLQLQELQQNGKKLSDHERTRVLASHFPPHTRKHLVDPQQERYSKESHEKALFVINKIKEIDLLTEQIDILKKDKKTSYWKKAKEVTDLKKAMAQLKKELEYKDIKSVNDSEKKQTFLELSKPPTLEELSNSLSNTLKNSYGAESDDIIKSMPFGEFQEICNHRKRASDSSSIVTSQAAAPWYYFMIPTFLYNPSGKTGEKKLLLPGNENLSKTETVDNKEEKEKDNKKITKKEDRSQKLEEKLFIAMEHYGM